MKILVINCGSSSVKYQLIDTDNEIALAKGLISRIGMSASVLTHKPHDRPEVKVSGESPPGAFGLCVMMLDA